MDQHFGPIWLERELAWSGRRSRLSAQPQAQAQGPPGNPGYLRLRPTKPPYQAGEAGASMETRHAARPFFHLAKALRPAACHGCGPHRTWRWGVGQGASGHGCLLVSIRPPAYPVLRLADEAYAPRQFGRAGPVKGRFGRVKTCRNNGQRQPDSFSWGWRRRQRPLKRRRTGRKSWRSSHPSGRIHRRVGPSRE